MARIDPTRAQPTASGRTAVEPSSAPRPAAPVAPGSAGRSSFESGSVARAEVVTAPGVPAAGELWGGFSSQVQAALAQWEVPPAASADQHLAVVLPDGDPLLRPTYTLPGRELWHGRMKDLLLSAGAVKDRPTAYFLAGPMGVGKIALAEKLQVDGVIPGAVARADADFIHPLVPEFSQLVQAGDGRAADVVHEEASAIGRAVLEQAYVEKRDVLHNTMLGSELQLARVDAAQRAGFERVVVALVAPLPVAQERAGAGGAWFSPRMLATSARDFAAGFDAVVAKADRLVLVQNDGARMQVIAHGEAGALTVLDAVRYQAFRDQAQLDVATFPER